MTCITGNAWLYANSCNTLVTPLSTFIELGHNLQTQQSFVRKRNTLLQEWSRSGCGLAAVLPPAQIPIFLSSVGKHPTQLLLSPLLLQRIHPLKLGLSGPLFDAHLNPPPTTRSPPSTNPTPVTASLEDPLPSSLSAPLTPFTLSFSISFRISVTQGKNKRSGQDVSSSLPQES